MSRITIKKSIVVIGEGETEWHYVESIRKAYNLRIKLAPGLPQHSDIKSMSRKAEQCVNNQYDYVICLVDMDHILQDKKEIREYHKARKNSSKNVVWLETNPCTEFWFLLHFYSSFSIKRYKSYRELLPTLQKYMPKYEKTKDYFRKVNLFSYLTEHGKLNKAMEYAKMIESKRQETNDEHISYSQLYELFEILNKINK